MIPLELLRDRLGLATLPRGQGQVERPFDKLRALAVAT
jgi:hypothetical protein